MSQPRILANRWRLVCNSYNHDTVTIMMCGLAKVSVSSKLHVQAYGKSLGDGFPVYLKGVTRV
eukprot:1061835-Amphidinium_carterae.1